MKRFWNFTEFTEYVINRAKEGNPINPRAINCVNNSFTDINDGEYDDFVINVPSLNNHMLQSVSPTHFVHDINYAISKGAELDASKVRRFMGLVTIPIIKKVDNVTENSTSIDGIYGVPVDKKGENVDEETTTKEEVSEASDDQSEVSSVDDLPQGEEDSTPSEDVLPSEGENTEVSENTEGEQEVVGEPEGDTEEFDIDYANSLKVGVKALEAKEKLKQYARTFNVELDKRVAFDKMLEVLVEELNKS